MCLVGARVPGLIGGVELRTARVTSGCQLWTSLVWCVVFLAVVVVFAGRRAVVVVVVVAVVAVVVVLPRTLLVADVVGGCACA